MKTKAQLKAEVDFLWAQGMEEFANLSTIPDQRDFLEAYAEWRVKYITADSEWVKLKKQLDALETWH